MPLLLNRVIADSFHSCAKFLRNMSLVTPRGRDTAANILKTSEGLDAVRECARLLERGGVLAVPTDTIYGLTASALDTGAIERIYSIKGRTKMRPLAICVGKINDIDKWAINTLSTDLLNELLPGPVTLVMRRRESLNPSLNLAIETVGVRIPHSHFITELAQHFDKPLALTSANVSNEKSTLAIEEFQSLWPQLDAVVDGGRIGDDSASRDGSTVVDVSVEGYYRIIRPGCALIQTSTLLMKYGLKESS